MTDTEIRSKLLQSLVAISHVARLLGDDLRAAAADIGDGLSADCRETVKDMLQRLYGASTAAEYISVQLSRAREGKQP